jgi:hypothetical protein
VQLCAIAGLHSRHLRLAVVHSPFRQLRGRRGRGTTPGEVMALAGSTRPWRRLPWG